MILEFILANPYEKYPETEADKAHYLTCQIGILLTTLPGRMYYGIKPTATTRRYFIDRFPIFLPAPHNPLGLPPVVTFAYYDTLRASLFSYFTHLHQLPNFNLVFASSKPSKFERASAFFAKTFGPKRQPDTIHLHHYFELRKLWGTQHTADLTRADRDFLWDATCQFQANKYEAAYHTWTSQGLSEDQIRALISDPTNYKTVSFHTYVQPQSYAIFSTESRRDYRRPPKDESPSKLSAAASAPCEQ